MLPHLETFAAAAELGSFSAAARSLRLTRAAVSQRIQSLERKVGVALFRRRGGHAFLTQAGERLVPFAQRIVTLHQQARQAVTGEETPVTAELTVAASSIPGEHLLPALLAVFRQRHPHIQVRVSIADSQAVLRDVERGKASLGLTGWKEDSKNLEFRPFARDEMVLVVPAGDSWAHRKHVSLEQLCKRPFVLRKGGSGSRLRLEQGLRQAGRSINDLNIALELGSNESVKEAVLQGVGVTIISENAIDKEKRLGQLAPLRVQGLSLQREMFIAWDRRRALSIAARLLLDFLQARVPAENRP